MYQDDHETSLPSQATTHLQGVFVKDKLDARGLHGQEGTQEAQTCRQSRVGCRDLGQPRSTWV